MLDMIAARCTKPDDEPRRSIIQTRTLHQTRKKSSKKSGPSLLYSLSVDYSNLEIAKRIKFCPIL
jgi:hypothetical protein